MPDPIFNGVFDDQFAPGAHIGVGAGDYTMSATEYAQGLAFTAVGGNRTGARIILPRAAKVSVWRGDPANTFPVEIHCGSGSVDLDPGAYLTIITDKNGNISAASLGEAVTSQAWQTIDTDHQAVAGEHLDVDSSDGAVAAALPADPAKFDQVYFSNLLATLATHALTVLRHPDRVTDYTIGGEAEDMTIDADGAEFSLKYDGVSNWVVIV